MRPATLSAGVREQHGASALMLGSHIDSVRRAGTTTASRVAWAIEVAQALAGMASRCVTHLKCSSSSMRRAGSPAAARSGSSPSRISMS